MLNFYSIKQLEEMLGVTRQTIFNWRRTGELPEPLQIGGRIYWPKEKLTEFFNQKLKNAS